MKGIWTLKWESDSQKWLKIIQSELIKKTPKVMESFAALDSRFSIFHVQFVPHCSHCQSHTLRAQWMKKGLSAPKNQNIKGLEGFIANPIENVAIWNWKRNEIHFLCVNARAFGVRFGINQIHSRSRRYFALAASTMMKYLQYSIRILLLNRFLASRKAPSVGVTNRSFFGAWRGRKGSKTKNK